MCWVYLLEEDIVHDDHGRDVGVGASHHSQLRGLGPRARSLWSLLHHWAGWILRVCGVHCAQVLWACIFRTGRRKNGVQVIVALSSKHLKLCEEQGWTWESRISLWISPGVSRLRDACSVCCPWVALCLPLGAHLLSCCSDNVLG